MRRVASALALVALCLPTLSGCTHNPLIAPPPASWPGQQQNTAVAQIDQLRQRAEQLDQDNRDLHAQIAQSQQQQQILRDQVALLQKQLADTAEQLRGSQLAQRAAEQKVQTLLASTRHRGGATIRANNSVRESLQAVQVPGLEVRQDQDVVRVEIPADQLFQVGTAQMQPTATDVLDRVANAVAQHYPRQYIGIECYTDNGPLNGALYYSHHHLAAAQAVAIFDQLTRRNRLPSHQLFLLSHGPNHPRASNGTPAGRAANRRVELVIYPEMIQ